MNYIKQRELVKQVLISSGINESNISYSKNTIPKAYPSAVVVLDSEKGVNATSKRVCSYEYQINVFLIADVNNSEDADNEIISLVENFKSNYQSEFCKGIKEIEYYPARAEAGRKVMIAKITI